MTQYFSEEQLLELDRELEFITRCIGITVRDFNYHRQQNGQEAAHKTLESFQIEKLKLEIKIKTLNEFLFPDGED